MMIGSVLSPSTLIVEWMFEIRFISERLNVIRVWILAGENGLFHFDFHRKVQEIVRLN